MEEIQFFNYLFSIGALILSGISIYIAVQADKIREDWQKEAKDLRDRIRDLSEKPNNRR